MEKINSNVVIAALARDCESALINNIPLIEELRKSFSWSQVVIVENDSKDNTKQVLANWESSSKQVKIISQDFGTVTIPNRSEFVKSPSTSFYRIEKMARYRNIYLDYIKTIEHQIDYLIIVDIDVEKFSVNDLLYSIKNAPSDWGGLFSNGFTKRKILGFSSKIYFDIFAIFEYPKDREYSYTAESLDDTFKRINRNLHKKEYYPVISAFGGIGIYKYDVIKSLSYTAVRNPKNHDEAICEHIPFHSAIIDKGFKNYISTNFSVVYGHHNLGMILKVYLPFSLLSFLDRSK